MALSIVVLSVVVSETPRTATRRIAMAGRVISRIRPGPGGRWRIVTTIFALSTIVVAVVSTVRSGILATVLSTSTTALSPMIAMSISAWATRRARVNGLVTTRIQARLVKVVGVLELIVARHLAEPARVRAKSEKLKRIKVGHTMVEHAALLGEIALAGAHPVSAEQLAT